MSEEWQYQVRIDLSPATAELARRDPGAPELRPLTAILARHQATLTCQFDLFAGYVAEAEREGVGHYPLYEWTKRTIEDPAKKAKYVQVFTFYIEDHEVYPKARAEALVADLRAQKEWNKYWNETSRSSEHPELSHLSRRCGGGVFHVRVNALGRAEKQ